MQIRLDAGEQKFFERELEFIKAETYKTDFPEFKARTLLPIDTSGGNWANTVTYKESNVTGRAEIASNYADDAPMVGSHREEVSHKIKSLRASYGWSLQDIRAAARIGERLQANEALIAKEAILREENEIALLGNSDHGLKGLLNHDAITDEQVLNDGTGSSRLWADKTGDQIVRDIVDRVKTMDTDSFGVEKPNTLLVPSVQFMDIATRRLDTNLTMTILDYVKTQLAIIGITDIESLTELAGIGAGSTDVFMLYTRRPDKVNLNIPQAFEQFEPQRVNMFYKVDCHSRIGGVQFMKPKSAIRGYGI